MVGQRIGGDIVGGKQCAIHQVTQAHRVPGLEAGGTARTIRECSVGQRHGDGKIDFLEVRPIENHHAGGDLREAGLALGATQWRTVAMVIMPAARSGLITAIILGIARVVGETAPLLLTIGGADAIGPILLGLKKPVHVLQLGSSVRSIINMALVAVVDAQLKSRIDTDEAVQRSSWWKRLKKKNK